MLISVYLEIVLMLVQDSYTVCAKRTTGSKRTRWNSYVTSVLWNLIFVRLKIMLVSVQDRCKVCAKHTIDTKIILDTLDGTTR
jgi:hypothetical protein